MFAPEPFRKQWAKLGAPKSHRFVTHFDSSFGEQVLDVAVAEIETMWSQTAY